MAKTSIAVEEGQEGSLREGLEAAIRERVREVMEMVLEEEVEAALGAGRSERVVERVGYRSYASPLSVLIATRSANTGEYPNTSWNPSLCHTGNITFFPITSRVARWFNSS